MPNQSSVKENRAQVYNGEIYRSTTPEPKLKETISIQSKIQSANIYNRTTKLSNDSNCERPPNELCSQVSCNHGTIRKRLAMGKSTIILVVIVVFFVITHSNRLALKVYMTIFPHLNTRESFVRCLHMGR